jgi:hypothetical protein
VIVNVPLVVIGLPVTLMPVPAVAATDVTVPTAVPEPTNITVPPAFLLYNFWSARLIAISPTSKSVDNGTLDAVDVFLRIILLAIGLPFFAI